MLVVETIGRAFSYGIIERLAVEPPAAQSSIIVRRQICDNLTCRRERLPLIRLAKCLI